MDLAGIKLLVEAHMMPCLGFLVKTVTMTHCCSAVAKQCLHRTKDISAPCTALPARGCGHSQHSWPKLAKGTSHSTCIVLSSKSWGEGREMGDIWSNGICLTKKPLHVKPCFPGGGWTPPACQWEVANEFLMHCLCWAFTLPNSFCSSPSRSAPTPWGMAAAGQCRTKPPEISTALNHNLTLQQDHEGAGSTRPQFYISLTPEEPKWKVKYWADKCTR